MFSKSVTEDDTGAPQASRPARDHSHLAADLRIQGNLTSSGAIEVHGTVEGDIDAQKLTIGNGGTVSGKLRAEDIEIKGRLSGSASCRRFTLRSDASADVQVNYETMVIESGATIEGKFKHGGGNRGGKQASGK